MTKRFFDLLLTLPGILCLSPLFLLTALLVRIKIGKPIFFIQKRPGLHGKPFRMYKFRTMTDERDAAGNLLSSELYVAAQQDSLSRSCPKGQGTGTTCKIGYFDSY
ncbi:MAG: hypothetical protein D3913_14145 [Candidatus Electrothrix sp. LOE1_4_5]|nr:hypothetical protein [Candidatus Electrothrix gigas]